MSSTTRNKLCSTCKEQCPRNASSMSFKCFQTRTIRNRPNFNGSITRRCHNTLINRRKCYRKDSSLMSFQDHHRYKLWEPPYTSSTILNKKHKFFIFKNETKLRKDGIKYINANLRATTNKIVNW